jgi:hypothetical protein
MSKVGEYYRESDEMNGNIPEPSDEELQSIEAEIEFLDNWSTDDLD